MAKKKVFKPGLLLGHKFILDDNFLKYEYVYGKSASVPLPAIKSVVVDVKGRGTGLLKLIGNGVELASIEMPYSAAEKTQKWLIKELNLFGESSS